MSEVIRKEHNVSTLMRHIVACPAKYQRAVLHGEADKKIRFLENRNRTGSCAFSGSVSADVQSQTDSTDNKKYNGEENNGIKSDGFFPLKQDMGRGELRGLTVQF
jgi:hypothetical protein